MPTTDPPNEGPRPQSPDTDPEAIGERLAAHLPALRASARVLMGSALLARESVEDVVQSTCREALESVRRNRLDFQGTTALRVWLYQALRHVIIDKSRRYSAGKRDIRQEVALDGSITDQLAQTYASVTPSRVASGREQVERFEAAMEQLREEDREAVLLCKIVGLSSPEIAAALQINPATIRSRLMRGLERLRTILNRD